MNPAPWRDDDQAHRTVALSPPTDIGAALQQSFEAAQPSSEMIELLTRLG